MHIWIFILQLAVHFVRWTNALPLQQRFILDPDPVTWTSWEQYAACSTTCVKQYELRTRDCCTTGNNMVCLSLPWDELKPYVGSCPSTTPAAVTKSSTTPPSTPVSILSVFCSHKDTIRCSTTSIQQQVCTTNGQVFDNSCLFSKAKCDDPTLVDTPCKSTTVMTTPTTATMDPISAVFCRNKDSIVCSSSDSDPVCSTDGLLYKNRCLFSKAKCDDPTLVDTPCKSTTVVTMPTTATLDPLFAAFCTQKDAIICSSDSDPVCSTDGVLYKNRCLFSKAKCDDPTMSAIPCGSTTNAASLTLTTNPASSDKAILGDPYSMSCTYSGISSSGVITIELYKSDNLNDFLVSVVVTSGAITIDSNWQSRLTVKGPSSSSLTTTTVRFNEIKCDNQATYQWKVIYLDGSVKFVTKDVDIIVKVKPAFSTAVSFTPATNLKEGDEVIFTCEGDIGKNDYGQINWFYFLQGSSTAVPITTGITSGALEEINGDNQCSYRRTSTLKLTLQRTMNNFLVRCTVQQDIMTPEGDGYWQTSDIPVQYWPEEPTITKNPQKDSYTEGQDTLILTCAADSNPSSSYHWILPNTNVTQEGPVLNFTSLTVGDAGTYICVAQNTINTLVYSANHSVVISVAAATTTLETTTPVTTVSSAHCSSLAGISCGTHFNLVCSTSGKMYANQCMFAKDACSDPSLRSCTCGHC